MSTEKSVYPRMHVSLYVSNLAATVNFYNTFFNKQAEKIKKGYAKYILDQPSLIISFVENPARVHQGFGHLGIQVETKEEMERQLAIAREQNTVSREEIGTACCYAVQDKFWVEDPDGYEWEIYYFHKDVSFNDPHYEDGSSDVCCIAEEESEEKEKVAMGELGTNTSEQSSCCS